MERLMKKSIPGAMFGERDQVRLSSLQGWILDHGVTAGAQPVAEKPWTTFMGRAISVPDMPEASQKHLGLFDKSAPGQI